MTAAFWYRAAAGLSSGSMPALLMLLLLLFQLACGASAMRKVWLQQACSLPSFWPTILQIALPEIVTGKLRQVFSCRSWQLGWLAPSRAACQGCRLGTVSAPARMRLHTLLSPQIQRCQPHALCMRRSIRALQSWRISPQWPRVCGTSRLLTASQAWPPGGARCCQPWCRQPLGPLPSSASRQPGLSLPSPPSRASSWGPGCRPMHGRPCGSVCLPALQRGATSTLQMACSLVGLLHKQPHAARWWMLQLCHWCNNIQMHPVCSPQLTERHASACRCARWLQRRQPQRHLQGPVLLLHRCVQTSQSAAVEQTCCVGMPSESSRNALHVCTDAIASFASQQLLPAPLAQ